MNLIRILCNRALMVVWLSPVAFMRTVSSDMYNCPSLHLNNKTKHMTELQCKNDNITKHNNIANEILEEGLKNRLHKATSNSCQELITQRYIYYVKSQVLEETQLLLNKQQNIHLRSQCNSSSYRDTVSKYPLQQDNAVFPVVIHRNASTKYDIDESSNSAMIAKNERSFSLLYILLVHDHPTFTQRLLQALINQQRNLEVEINIVIHIDKESHELYQFFTENLSDLLIMDNKTTIIHFLPHNETYSISWGGFSIVKATLKCLQYSVTLGINFDYVINLSGRHYPLKPNTYIIQTLKAHKQHSTVFMDISPVPTIPQPSELWQQYVECDKQLHRIGQYYLLRHMYMFQGSQWFALPRLFIDWILTDPLPQYYAEYAQLTLAPDEHFFSTLLMNSPFCDLPRLGSTLVFVIFDRWENQKTPETRDEKKCLAVDTSVCGRSPITIKPSLMPYLRTTTAMFARKFDPEDTESTVVVDELDRIVQTNSTLVFANSTRVRIVLVDHESTGNNENQWCMELQSKSKYVKMNRCVVNSTIDNIQSDEKGVNSYGTTNKFDNQVFDMRCIENNVLSTTWDNSSLCILILSNTRTNNVSMWTPSNQTLCLDISGGSSQEQAYFIAHACTGRWNQVFRLRPNTLSSSWSFVMPAAIRREAQGKVMGVSQDWDRDIEICMKMDNNKFLQTVHCHNMKSEDHMKLKVIS